MTDKERIEIMREGWSESIAALGVCRVFLTALIDHEWLGHNRHQVKEVLDQIQYASKIADRDFKPGIVNPEVLND